MSCSFASDRSVVRRAVLRRVAARPWLLTVALVLSGAACVNAQIYTIDAGSGGQGGAGLTGSGGADTGLGGDGSGGAGSGGMGGTGGDGAGGAAAGGSGMGGSGAGGAIVDAGTGGMNVDAPYDGPTGMMPFAAGQLVITEIMADTNDVQDESGEWFELYNPSTTDTYDLFGCDVSDSGNHDTIAAHIIVGPMSYVTMARFGTTAGGFPPTYDYHTTLTAGGTPDTTADVKFSNSGDSVHLACGLAAIDGVDFHAWLGSNGMVPNGKSYSLDPNHYSATDNDLESSWCIGTTVYHTSDRGTPNHANPPCTCMDGAADGGCAF